MNLQTCSLEAAQTGHHSKHQRKQNTDCELNSNFHRCLILFT